MKIRLLRPTVHSSAGCDPRRTALRRAALSLAFLAAACACAGGDPAWAAKSRTPITSGVKKLRMSPEELRIRVRALIRPTLGIVEEAADRSFREATDPVVRRGILVWKIETTTTFLSAMLRTDPVLALADAWGYANQVETLLRSPAAAERFGKYAPDAAEAMAQIQARFREFTGSLQEDISGEGFEAKIRKWAEEHPIEGALYRRPSMDSEVAGALATSGGGGAFAAIGNLDETTADVMTRMDLYTMYLPRLARWEAELTVDDLAQGIDSRELAADVDQFARAVDRIAAVSELAPQLVESERTATLEALRGERLAATQDLRGERRAVIDAIRQERIASLQEAEAIAQRLMDRSGGPVHDSVHKELEELVQDVEAMRKRMTDDAASALDSVVDHAFLRAVQLLFIAAGLGAVGVVLYARFLRR